MPTTTRNSLPYPASSDAPNVPADMGDLASALDTKLLPKFASTAARDAAIVSPVEGDAAVVAGKLSIYRGTRWRPTAPLVQTAGRNYGTGARVSPSATFTDTGAMSVTNLAVGQMLAVDLFENVTVDGATVQTALPDLAVTGASFSGSLSFPHRYPPVSSEYFSEQLYRKFLLTATGATVTINPKLTNGTGAPDLVMTNALLIVTLVDSI